MSACMPLNFVQVSSSSSVKRINYRPVHTVSAVVNISHLTNFGINFASTLSYFSFFSLS